MSKTNKIIYISVAVIITILIVTVSILSSSLTKAKADRDRYKHNYDTAVTEMDTLRRKNGDLIAMRDSYILTIDELEFQDILSKKEKKELEKLLDDKISYISKLETEISLRPVIRDTVIYRDSIEIVSRWSGKDAWYYIAGTSKYSYLENNICTSVEDVRMNVPLRVGLTDEWKIFVTSDNPYVKFSSIDGAVVNKKSYIKRSDIPRIGFGAYVGMNAGWNMISPKGTPWNQQIYFGPGVGVGMYIRIY